MTAQRMVFLTTSIVVFAGIWLTGFDKAHWILYIPPSALLFAGVTGICPGINFWRKMGLQ